MKKFLLLSLVFSAMLILSGCGGFDDKSPTETPETPVVPVDPVDPTDPITKGIGTYNDSAVSGISYVCGTESGVTDEEGTFTFDVN
ncbi:MAG: hypothetical protein DRQ78_10970, partial [Epsilonproteobacteria bacterium]